MKKIVVALWLFVSLCSCQKEIYFDTPPAVLDTSTVIHSDTPFSSLVKTSVINGEESNYYYDSKDRVTSVVSKSGNKTVFEYNSNNTFTVDLFSGTSLVRHELYFVNSFGFVDSVVHYAKDTSAEKYVYDANKLPTIEKDYKVTNGVANMINTITTEYNSAFNTTRDYDVANNEITYDYYTNYPNSLNTGLVYFTKNRNLVKTTTIKTRSFNGVLNHAYTFDSFNRITSETITNSTTGTVETKEYGY